MVINFLDYTYGGRCTLTFEETDHWLRATWTGPVDAVAAMQGATNYLAQAGPFHCPFLLNDNVGLHGPWFDSVEWLERVWLPNALRLGLRYVAHVVQADTGHDILSLTFPESLRKEVELQIFHQVVEAEDWLQACQQRIGWPLASVFNN